VIELQDHPEGVVVPIRAQPGARKAGVQGEHNGALKVAVTARAIDGQANQALVELFRDWLNLKRSQVALIGGTTSRDKRLLVRGATREQLSAKIQSMIG
jgi:uncharacterized protein (TIGR00251 family)